MLRPCTICTNYVYFETLASTKDTLNASIKKKGAELSELITIMRWRESKKLFALDAARLATLSQTKREDLITYLGMGPLDWYYCFSSKLF